MQLSTRLLFVPLLTVTASALAACGEPPAHDAGTDAPVSDVAHDVARDALATETGVDALPGDVADGTMSALDAGEDTTTLDSGFDSGSVDAPDVTAIDMPSDTGPADVPVDVPADVPAGPQHVHIMIDNFCNTSVSPMSVTVPVSSRTMFSFHNHSVDYNADVWMSYGGGYLDLATGATWNDPIGHCNTPTMHDEYADISIAGGGSSSCPGVRFMIQCR